MTSTGSRRFTAARLAEIRVLLVEKETAERARQKQIRARLRREFNFYILDFDQSRTGFTASDLDALIADGTIEVSGP